MWRPPRRFPGTRRPVSSEAPGRGDSPARHERRKPRSEHSPLRRSPFPSVSSSSSSFVSCGFPRLFRLLLQLRGSAPGAASPGRLFNSPSIGFKSVKIMFGLSLCSGAAPAASVVPSGFVFTRLRPALSRRPPSSVQVRMAGFRRPRSRSTTRSWPPVPLVCCSFRSWFVSQVRFVVPFNSACFSSVRLALFASARFPSFQSRFVVLFLSSFSRVVPAHRRFNIYFSRILYTTGGDFQMYFLSENMFFLRIVQDIDINFEIPKRMDTVFFTIPETTQKSQKKGVFPVLPKGDRPRQKKRHRAMTKVNEQ